MTIRCKKFSAILKGLFLFSVPLSISATNAAQLTTSAVVDMIAPILVGVGEELSKNTQLRAPQILFAIGGTKAYGGCSDYQGSNIIPGSYYCPSTNTILLEVFELDALRSKYGDGAIAYALYHEFGHYVQFAFKTKFTDSTREELHADCLAGMMLNWTAKKLSLDENDIREIYNTAYSIGGSSHGTGLQRLNAVRYGFETGKDTGCVENALRLNQSSNTLFKLPASAVTPVNDASSTPINTPKRNYIQHKKVNNYLGDFPLWGWVTAKIYKIKSGDDYLNLKTMNVRYVDTRTGIARSSLVYIDCFHKRWSFHPDLPNSEYSMGADTKILESVGC